MLRSYPGKCPDRVTVHSGSSVPHYQEDPLPSPDPDFTGLDAKWAEAVARGVLRIGARYSVPALHEVWVADDLALHIRYALGAEALAVRHAHLDVDPTSDGPPTHSARLASDIFHDLHTDPDAWRDERGYRWWGDEPADGWPAAVRGGRPLALAPDGGSPRRDVLP